MKKLLVVMMVLSVSLCFAGDFGLFKVAPTVGIIQPEELDLGFQFGAKAYVGSLMDGKIGLYPVANYWSAGFDDLKNYSFSNLKIGIDGHYDLSEYFDGLYAGAGLALNHTTSKWDGLTYEIDYTTGTWEEKDKEYKSSDTKLGISVLVGYNIDLSGKPLFFEASYDIINNFNTLGVKAGMYFDLKK